jgi:hypothetical protein
MPTAFFPSQWNGGSGTMPPPVSDGEIAMCHFLQLRRIEDFIKGRQQHRRRGAFRRTEVDNS